MDHGVARDDLESDIEQALWNARMLLPRNVEPVKFNRAGRRCVRWPSASSGAASPVHRAYARTDQDVAHPRSRARRTHPDETEADTGRAPGHQPNQRLTRPNPLELSRLRAGRAALTPKISAMDASSASAASHAAGRSLTTCSASRDAMPMCERTRPRAAATLRPSAIR